METLAFLHAAVAHEDPTPDPAIVAFENINLKTSSSLAAGLMAVGVMAATLSHTEQAQATIYYGQQGSGVSSLQSALGVSRDGIFGSQTLSALKTFQANKGLVVDGVAGPASLTALGLVANLSSGGSTGGSVPVAGGVYVTAASGLVVRNAPAGYAIGNYGYGARVSLTGAQQYAGGRNWSQVASGGWVASSYLSYSGGSGGGTTAPVAGGVYVKAGSGLLVRNAPAGSVIGSRGYGQKVSLTGAEQVANGYTWAQLANGGWVAKDYLSFN